MGRTLKVNQKTGRLRCDYCHRPIEQGKTAIQIREGKAQGLYHGRQCYQHALEVYKAQEGKV